ncbi:hypothetical protein B1A57_04030 [Corynebacterium diphtheriae]|nr:hypothetical protein B1A57_04030 [Corynebacterium diphtheriae]
MIQFEVNGIPARQGSKNLIRRGGKSWMVENDKNLPAWRDAIKRAAPTLEAPLNIPLTVSAEIRLASPKKPQFEAPATRNSGDLDKYARAIGDALEQAGVIRDDSRICRWRLSKRFAKEGEQLGALITIEPH